MSSVSFLIDFQVNCDLVINDTNITSLLIENCLPIINKNLPDSLQFKLLFEKHFQLLSFFLTANSCDHLLKITIYRNGTISLTSENCTSQINFREISDRLKLHLKVSNYQFVPLKRASFIKYMPTSDGRIMEYDCDELLFEKQSDYQLVQIYHSKTFGNMLVLEGLQNLSESDLIYTETLMHRNVENYCDKEVLILGGGDGALLYELLKEKPQFVTMIEIDDVVVQCCSKFMRTVCGDVLDTMSAKNYEIIIDDCFNCFAKFIEANKKFDYIFGDLTDIPIGVPQDDSTWDFIKKILGNSWKILKPHGKFLTHGTGANNTKDLEAFEAKIKETETNLDIEKSVAFIPSFYEHWVFYKIARSF